MTRSDLILVVDDEPGMRRLVSRTLAEEGFRVETASGGGRMRQVLSEKLVDLVILDLMLPGEDGLSLAKEISSQSDIPIIMLTGKDELIDKVVGLELGADDYVTKPFNGRELVARVRSVLRRHGGKAKGQTPLSDERVKFNGWVLDFPSHQLTSPEGRVTQLTTFEYQVFSELVSRPNRILSRDKIIELVYDRNRFPTERTIDIVIAKIRKKLNDNPKSPKFIMTVRNQGYTFIAKIVHERKSARSP